MSCQEDHVHELVHYIR